MAKKMGRPQIEIDKKQFESLCAMMCTKDEICGFFRCSEDTVSRWVGRTYPKVKGKNQTFAGIYKELSANGKISLRRQQFKLAEKSAAMAIFLGKNYLGQTDVQTVALDNKDDSIKAMGEYFADKKRNT